MTLTFPSDPGSQTPVNTYSPDSTPLSTDNGIVYFWDGSKWVANAESGYDARYVNVSGDTMTGDLTVPNLISEGTVTATNLPTNGTIVGYQQGSWTPVPVTGGIETLSSNVWWRNGKVVTVQAEVSAFNNNGNIIIQIGGLPYGDQTKGLGSVMSSRFNNPPNASLVNDGKVQFFKSGADRNNGWSILRHNDMLDANSAIWFSVSYITDDTTWTPSNGATVS